MADKARDIGKRAEGGRLLIPGNLVIIYILGFPF
jgi:hypothetical protein